MAASLIQEATIGNPSNPNLAKAFTSPVTAGSAIHVIAGQGGGSGVTYTVTDNNGGSYTQLDGTGGVGTWDSVSGQGLAHFVALNHPAGPTTVTVTYSQNVGACDLIIREIGGVTASPLDGHTINDQSSTSTPSASATNSNQPAFWSAFCLDGNGGQQPTSTNGTSGITLDGNSGCKGRTSSSAVSSTGSQTATFSYPSADSSLTAIAIFDATAPSGAALAGTPLDASTATGSLLTAIGMAAAGTDTSSSAAQLTNWATVTLTSPLYTGIGGILDPNFWLDSVPVVGSVVYYDPTNITVQPDGEIVSTTNNCSALVQFKDASGNWALGVVVITPLMVGYVDIATQALGSLSTGIQLVAAANALSVATGSLLTQSSFGGAAIALTTATGALTSAIQLAAAAVDAATASGALSQAQLSGAAVDSAAASGVLLTQITMLAAATDVSAAAGALVTRILAAANALSTSSAQGTLSSGIPLQGGAVALTAGTGALSTLIELAAAASSVVQASGALATQIQFAGNAIAAATAAGAVKTANVIAGSAASITAATGALTTVIELAGQALSQSVANASVVSGIPLSGGAVVESEADPALLTDPAWGGPIAIVRAPIDGASFRDGPLPFGAFFQRAGSHLVYAIDWTGWLENHWAGDTAAIAGTTVVVPSVDNGYEYPCVTSGRTGETEPTWPLMVGDQVQDGSATWQCAPVDQSSLNAQLIQATWTAPQGVMATASLLSGEMTLVMLDTRYAVPATDYDCIVTVITTTGEQQVGKIRLKVR